MIINLCLFVLLMNVMIKKREDYAKSVNFIHIGSTMSLSLLLLLLILSLSSRSFSRCSSLVHFSHDGIGDSLQIFLFWLILLDLGMVIGWHPVLHLTDLSKQSLFVTLWDFPLEFLIVEGVFKVHAVSLKTVLCLDFLPHFFILILEFLCLFD